MNIAYSYSYCAYEFHSLYTGGDITTESFAKLLSPSPVVKTLQGIAFENLCSSKDHSGLSKGTV